MKPEELRAIIFELGHPTTAVAKFLGVDERTMRHWLQGDRSIPEIVARVMRMADAGKLSLERLTTFGSER